MLAAAAESVRLIAGDEGRALRERLWQNANTLRDGLAKHGIPVAGGSAIIPIIIGDEKVALELSRKLFERGIFVSAIRYPTVARGKARLRVTATAAHTSEQIDQLVRELAGLRKCS